MENRTREEWQKFIDEVKEGHMSSTGQVNYFDGGKKIFDELVEHKVIKKDDSVIDMGCGNGKQAIHMVGFVGEYYGFDVMTWPIKHLIEGFAPWDNFTFECFDFYNDFYTSEKEVEAAALLLPQDDETVDAIYASSLFSHMNERVDIDRYISEAYRVLKKGGVMWTTWFVNPPNEPHTEGDRTVWSHEEILKFFDAFELVEEYGGETTEWHDQRRFIVKKV